MFLYLYIYVYNCMFVSALPDPTCNSEKSANGGNKQILLLLLLTTDMSMDVNCKKESNLTYHSS